jgi:predicted acylesterase/phospholipase RssA
LAEISDDIRRRLDQRNLWDVLVDGESGDGESDEADKSSVESPKQIVEPKKNNVPAVINDAVVKEVQAKKASEQPIAKEIVEEIVQQVEVQEPIASQLQVHQPQITERIVQQPKVQQPTVQQREASQSKAQQPQVHQPIVQQSQIQRPHAMEPTIVRQEVQPSQLNKASMMTPTSNEKTNEKQPTQITVRDLGMHDYLFGTSLRNHSGNRKYHEVASNKMALYQNAKPSEKAGIAASVVNGWRALDPPGRFLKFDNGRGCFTDVGNEKAIAKTKKILRAKPASPTRTSIEGSADSIPGRESSTASTLNVSANLKRSEDDPSSTNAIIASIAQMAEEELEKETVPPQATPSTKEKHVKTKENRNMLRPILKLVPLLVILLIAAFSYAPPHNRKTGFEILFIPAVVVLTLFLVMRLTMAYSSFALTAATITDRHVTSPSRRQVRLFPRVFLLPFLASVLIFVPVSLYLQPERVMTVLLMPKVALLTLSPIPLFLAFAVAMIVTHEAPHHHVEGGLFREAYNFVEDTFRSPPSPSTIDERKCLPTLRDYLSHPEGFHMGFAPAFFGFFAYFGALAALEEATGGLIVPPIAEKRKGNEDESTSLGLRSVSGASAGAMAATLLACGIDPSVAAEFTSKFTWGMVSDPPGIGGYVKGNRFEEAMVNFLLKEASKLNRADDRSSDTPLQFDEALIPCAVSGFDLFRMKGVILSSGSMAKAARASAGFPGLFQPVAWRENSDEKKWLPDSLLIDGGIRDGLGLAGLGAFAGEKKRVVNVVVGDFGFRGASGIQSLPEGVNASSLVSIAIVGTPMCGPWAMENGKRAVESARKAMLLAFDTPMEKGDGENHYVLRVDASKFLD